MFASAVENVVFVVVTRWNYVLLCRDTENYSASEVLSRRITAQVKQTPCIPQKVCCSFLLCIQLFLLIARDVPDVPKEEYIFSVMACPHWRRNRSGQQVAVDFLFLSTSTTPV